MKLQFPVESPRTDTSAGKWRSYGIGIDVHEDMIWVCVLRPDYLASEQKREVCKFETDVAGLTAARQWLEEKVPESRFTPSETITFPCS